MYTYIYTCKHTSTDAHIHPQMSAHMYTYIFVCQHTCRHTSTDADMYSTHVEIPEHTATTHLQRHESRDMRDMRYLQGTRVET